MKKKLGFFDRLREYFSKFSFFKIEKPSKFFGNQLEKNIDTREESEAKSQTSEKLAFSEKAQFSKDKLAKISLMEEKKSTDTMAQAEIKKPQPSKLDIIPKLLDDMPAPRFPAPNKENLLDPVREKTREDVKLNNRIENERKKQHQNEMQKQLETSLKEQVESQIRNKYGLQPDQQLTDTMKRELEVESKKQLEVLAKKQLEPQARQELGFEREEELTPENAKLLERRLQQKVDNIPKQYSPEAIKMQIDNQARREVSEPVEKEKALKRAELQREEVRAQEKAELALPSDTKQVILNIKNLFSGSNHLNEYTLLQSDSKNPKKFDYKVYEWLNGLKIESEANEITMLQRLFNAEFTYIIGETENKYKIIDLVYERATTEENMNLLCQLLYVHTTYREHNQRDPNIEREITALYNKVAADKNPALLEKMSFKFFSPSTIDLKVAFPRNLYDRSNRKDEELLQRKIALFKKANVGKNLIDRHLEEMSKPAERPKTVESKKAETEKTLVTNPEKKQPNQKSDVKQLCERILEHKGAIDQLSAKDIKKNILTPDNSFKDFAEIAVKGNLTNKIFSFFDEDKKGFLKEALDFRLVYRLNGSNLCSSKIGEDPKLTEAFQNKIHGLLILGYQPKELKEYIKKENGFTQDKGLREPKKVIDAINKLVDTKLKEMKARPSLPKEPQTKNLNPRLDPNQKAKTIPEAQLGRGQGSKN